MHRDAAKGTGKGIRVGYWLMSLKGKDLRKFYFDRNPKKRRDSLIRRKPLPPDLKKVVLIEH